MFATLLIITHGSTEALRSLHTISPSHHEPQLGYDKAHRLKGPTSAVAAPLLMFFLLPRPLCCRWEEMKWRRRSVICVSMCNSVLCSEDFFPAFQFEIDYLEWNKITNSFVHQFLIYRFHGGYWWVTIILLYFSIKCYQMCILDSIILHSRTETPYTILYTFNIKTTGIW